MTITTIYTKNLTDPKVRSVGDSIVLDSAKAPGTLSASAQRVLDAIWDSDGTGIGGAELVAASQVGKSTCFRNVKELAKAGLIRDLTPNGAARWVAVDSEASL